MFMVNPEQAVARREAANLTQIQAAKQVGITASYLSLIERGLRPNVSLPVLSSLARVYGCEVDDLQLDAPSEAAS